MLNREASTTSSAGIIREVPLPDIKPRSPIDHLFLMESSDSCTISHQDRHVQGEEITGEEDTEYKVITTKLQLQHSTNAAKQEMPRTSPASGRALHYTRITHHALYGYLFNLLSENNR